MDIEKAYSTHEIEKLRNFNLLLARNRHGLWRCTIRFYDAYLFNLPCLSSSSSKFAFLEYCL
jgi:hypothetical protein